MLQMHEPLAMNQIIQLWHVIWYLELNAQTEKNYPLKK